MPEELVRHFHRMGAIAGEVVFEGEICVCWRFVDAPIENEHETTHHLVEQQVRRFKEFRGEDLCLLEGEYPGNVQVDIAVYTGWYISELNRRDQILDCEMSAFPAKSYTVLQAERRALYRSANRHPEILWWRSYQDQSRDMQLRQEWDEERKREGMFADVAFAARKMASGLHIGSIVKTLVVPKGARTIPVPVETVGTITEETNLYWIVSFPQPLVDCDGVTWLPHDEKVDIAVGYLTEELCPVPVVGL